MSPRKKITPRKRPHKKKNILQKFFRIFGISLFILFLVFIIGFGILELYARVSLAFQGVENVKEQNLKLTKEVSLSRQFLLTACQDENEMRRYLFMEEKDCSTFFPELIAEEKKEKHIQEEFLEIFSVFFTDRKHYEEMIPSLIEVVKNIPENPSQKEADVRKEELMSLVKTSEIQKYVEEFSYALKKTSESGIELTKEKETVAEIFWHAEEKTAQMNLLKDQEIVYLRDFSQRYKAESSRLYEEKREKVLATLEDIGTDNSPRQNFLFLGRNGTNVDTIMLASIDHIKKRITLISLPRDLWVDSLKINAHYGRHGMDAFIAKIEDLLNQPIENYALIEMMAFAETVDGIGGIDYTFSRPLIDPSYKIKNTDGTEGTLFYAKGTSHLGGTEALRVARSRKTTSDFDRAKRQQQILQSIRSKLSGIGSIQNLLAIAPIFSKRVETDVTPSKAASIFWSTRGYEIRSGNVMSTQNILVSERLDLGNGFKPYILKPKDDNWELLPKFVWMKLLEP